MRVDLVVGVTISLALEIAELTGIETGVRWFDWVAPIIVGAGVALRRTRWFLPGLAFALAVDASGALVYGSGSNNQGLTGGVGAILIAYGTGAFLAGRRSWLALSLMLSICTINAATQGSQLVANLVFNDCVVAALPWLLGRTSRERAARGAAARERAERLDAEREHHVRSAALAERTRLAREIHDVIAHSVSVMVIQSAGARTVMASEPDRAETSVLAVEQAGREALAEMRRLLGVLGGPDDLRMLSPQPGLDDLPELVSRTDAAGLTARLRIEGKPVSVSPGLGLCAYRVVQEALTNAIKHAGAARAEVRVQWCGDALELEVIDDGRGAEAPPPAQSSGHGIIGMRERTALHGGSVEAGPAPAGGFAVRARIPLEALGAA
jgi:signal transduction histidine kinase